MDGLTLEHERDKCSCRRIPDEQRRSVEVHIVTLDPHATLLAVRTGSHGKPLFPGRPWRLDGIRGLRGGRGQHSRGCGQKVVGRRLGEGRPGSKCIPCVRGDRVGWEELHGGRGGGLDVYGGYVQLVGVLELLRRLVVWVQDRGVWGAEILGLRRFGEHEGGSCWQ